MDAAPRSLRSERGVNVEPFEGTAFLKIVDFQYTAGSVTGDVCRYVLYPAPGHPTVFRHVARVRLHNPASDPGRAGPVDTDPNNSDPHARRVPTWNVFGEWKIDQVEYLTVKHIPDACTSWWKSEFPAYIQPPGEKILLEPEGVTPPTSPVLTQFPEWIDPN